MKEIKSIELLLDGARGIYIPQNFVECCLASPDNINEGWDFAENAADILRQGPDHEEYWEAWDYMLDSCVFRKDGFVWELFLGPGGDLFAYCFEKMSIRERIEWREVLGIGADAVYTPTGTVSDRDPMDEIMTAMGMPPERWRQYNSGPESYWVEILDKDGTMCWRAPTFQPDFMFELFRAIEFEKYRMARGF